MSVFRAYGQSGSICVQRREVGDGDGPGQTRSCQSCWGERVQQIGKPGGEHTGHSVATRVSGNVSWGVAKWVFAVVYKINKCAEFASCLS